MWAQVRLLANTARKRSGLTDIAGATAVQIGTIGTGIAVAIIVAIFAIGDEIVELFNIVQTTLLGAGV